jgi:VWFA-related protein
VIFTDGDDRSSRARGEGTIRRIQQSDALVYTIAFGSGASDPATRRQLEGYANASGGRVFFVRHVAQLDATYAEILGELASQYVLSYEPPPGRRGWRRLDVAVDRVGVRVRARDGYLATAR